MKNQNPYYKYLIFKTLIIKNKKTYFQKIMINPCYEISLKIKSAL